MPYGEVTMGSSKVVEARDLHKWFELRGSFLDTLKGKKIIVKAVDGISFNIEKGETLGLVGESGCGKTTVGRLLLDLISPTSGEVYFNGVDLKSIKKNDARSFRRQAQIILQDPFSSLNPRMTVYNLIGESIDIHGLAKNIGEKEDLIIKSMENVNLVPIEDIVNKYPNELSGGQMQRVAIARTLVLDPAFIVCDEPVSMLDASIKANILNLLLSIRENLDVAQLFITHDIAVAKYVAHRIAVMYLGKIVEVASSDEIISHPLHPYTQALFSAVPLPDPRFKRGDINIKGDIPDVTELPSGCLFHPRCPFIMDICRHEEPELLDISSGHRLACHKK